VKVTVPDTNVVSGMASLFDEEEAGAAVVWSFGTAENQLLLQMTEVYAYNQKWRLAGWQFRTTYPCPMLCSRFWLLSSVTK
jgi:hypothetical protein